jgi:hypothetical protein
LNKRLSPLREYSARQEEYESLERLLQRHEAEIRSHIRVQQQLKIYVEELEHELLQTRQRQQRLDEIQAQNYRLTIELNEIKSSRLLSMSKILTKASNTKDTPLSKIRQNSNTKSKETVS